MGLLDKLWDDTVAGPVPETGLSKLRKYASFSSARSATINEDAAPISRSITILKTPNFRNFSVDTTSAPASPSGSSDPESPLTPTPRGDAKRLRRKSTSEAFERAKPRSPTVYDWVVISALDR
eukprot:TRINITY_DN848_c0_g3_i1.p1 TRINITY_DN848_c0_g3~~TRINITY_DN848_c0_g3_i1.p1  ORF type:complete len:123 (+),score=1.67 TRINITY_DN848_c0_g3_i1:137-505(+)